MISSQNRLSASGTSHRSFSPLLQQLAGSAILVGVIWIVYGRAVDSPFVFDDAISVVSNPSIVRLSPLVGDAEYHGPLNPPTNLPTTGRPLANLTLAANFHFGELNPFGYHLFNFALHAAAALLLFAIVQRTLELDFFRDQFGSAALILAWLSALLWAVHPLVTEPVIYVTQRTELLMAVFYLTTLYSSIRYYFAESATTRLAWFLSATLACLAGAACKETMVSAPVVVLLYDRVFVARSLRKSLILHWHLYAALALSWILLFALNYGGPRNWSAGFGLGVSLPTWWMTQCKVLVAIYLKLVLWPWPLSIVYDVPYIESPAAAWWWLAAAVLLGCIVGAALWRNRAEGFIGTAVLLILGPTLVVPIITEVAAERRMYLPLAALTSGAVVYIYRFVRESRLLRTSAALAALGLAFGLAAISIERLGAYRDSLTLWQDTVVHQPNSARARTMLGLALVNTGQTRGAIEQFQSAIRIDPDWPDARVNLGSALYRDGQTQPAIEEFQRALQSHPNLISAHNNLGFILEEQGMLQEALEHYQVAAKLNPAAAEIHNNLGNTLRKLGRTQDAIEEYSWALRLQPRYVEASFNLGVTYIALGRADEGRTAVRNALEMATSHNQTALAEKIRAWLVDYEQRARSRG